jgi:hypothetical protein
MTFTRLTIFILFISVVSAGAQSIRGLVKGDDGKELPFATIYVKQLGSGTTTNANGQYEIFCPAGEYDLVFQFLGFETQEKKVTVQGNVDLNITLKSQAIILRSTTVSATNEDPAYTIMRKAIAKASYHTQQLDSYTAQVYIKGTGKLVDYPWLAKKAIEKEGIKKNQAFVSESVTEIKYTRPNKFEERVISIRTDGVDKNAPTPFLQGSFYNPTINDVVSPLAPTAFAHYKFEYLGTFPDREYQISEIKVTPRLRGDNVVEGRIFIVEDWWSIHSLNVTTTKLGITFNIKQVYAPVEDKAWLPISNQFKVDGKFMGFKFEGNYLATISKYKIQLNPKLIVPHMEVIDEKVEPKQAKAIEKKSKAAEKKMQDLNERLSAGKEITRKELKQVMKEMEKEELKTQKEPDVISETSYKIDSGAYKSDSIYWTQVRPVPLSQDEVVGYKKMDSLAVQERKKEEGDTLQRSKNNKKGFQPWDILIGDSYRISKKSNLQIKTPQVWFNTVEGFYGIYRLNYGISLRDTNRTRINIIPTFRYSFAREKASGNLNFTIRNRKYRFEVEGGRYIQQFNADEPILPVVNTFMTLLLEENLMKIYERDYIDVLYRKRFNSKYSFETNWTWAERRALINNTNYKWVNRDKIEGYTPNAPLNLETATTDFAEHQSLVGSFLFTARPWLKFKIRNGRKSEINNSTPTVSLLYRKGFNSLLSSDINFDQAELGVKHSFKNGVRGRVDMNLRVGGFLNSDSLAFMDYKHFLGNRTPFSTTDPAGSFRLMDYYLFSTADKYFAANVHYNFRRFLVTSIYELRMLGISENVFVNYLATPTSKNYTELGYSIDGILRVFRLEGAVAFRDGKYLDYGFRIGISTTIAVNFSDN